MKDATQNHTARHLKIKRWSLLAGAGLLGVLALTTQLQSGKKLSTDTSNRAIAVAVEPVVGAIIGRERKGMRSALASEMILGNLDPQTKVQLARNEAGGNALMQSALPADSSSDAFIEVAQTTNDVTNEVTWTDLFGGNQTIRDDASDKTPDAATVHSTVHSTGSSMVAEASPTTAASDVWGETPLVETPLVGTPVSDQLDHSTTTQPVEVRVLNRSGTFLVSSDGTASSFDAPGISVIENAPSTQVAFPEAALESSPTTTASTAPAATAIRRPMQRRSAASTGNATDQQSTSRKVRPAALDLVTSGLDDNGEVRLMINKSSAIRTKRSIKTINVAAPDIADVLTLGPDLLLVTAKKPGTTQLMIWDDSGEQATMDVHVAVDVGAINEIIRTVVPGSDIKVAAANGSIVLKGEVPDIGTAEKLVALVQPYGTVVNFLEVAGGQQIMLEVQFAEVSKTVSRQLGINLATQDGVSFLGSNIGSAGLFGSESLGAGQFGLTVPENVRSATIFGKAEIRGSSIAYLVTALKENNLLRVLAKPNIVVMSGQTGRFVAGGEIPIPQPSQDGLAISYKEYGIKLNYTPIALGNGKIQLALEPEVSEIDSSVSVQIGGGPVPGFITRRVSTTVELADGETMAIAGLLSSNIVANKQVIPFLGELPVIGALFRSTRYQQRETELLVLITPRLVSAMKPGEVPALPGSQWQDPNDVELYFGGDQGKDVTPRAVPLSRNTNSTSAAPFMSANHSGDQTVSDSSREPLRERPTNEMPTRQQHYDRVRHVPVAPQNPGSKIADPVSDEQRVEQAPAMADMDTGLVGPQ